MRPCGIHTGAISQEMLKITIHDMSLKITDLRWQPHLLGANELYDVMPPWSGGRWVNPLRPKQNILLMACVELKEIFLNFIDFTKLLRTSVHIGFGNGLVLYYRRWQVITQTNTAIVHLYNSVIFEGTMLEYQPDCNASGGCQAKSARAKRGGYWLWQPPEALQEGQYTSVTKSCYYLYYHLISQCIIIL